MSPNEQEINSNSVESSASQHNQQRDLIVFTPGDQASQIGSDNRSLQGEDDDLDFTDNQSPGENNSTSSENLLEQEIALLRKSIKSLKVEYRVGFGLVALGLAGTIIGANWSTIAPVLQTVAQAIVATAPISGIVISSIAALGVALFCFYKIFEHRAEIKEFAERAFGKAKGGLEHVAEKTVEGAKKVYEDSRDSLKRGASLTGTAIANKLHRASGKTDYAEKIENFTEEQRKQSKGIREEINPIFQYPGNNSGLIKNILSQIVLKIDSKITLKEAECLTDSAEITRLKEQKDFISNLGENNLRSLVAERLLDKDKYFRDSTFSEHHDEIKEVIKQCRRDHYLHSQEKQERKAKRSSSLLLPESKSSSVRSTSSLPKSGSVSSVSTDGSTAELLTPTERKKVKTTPSFASVLSSSFKSSKAAAKETSSTEYKAFSESSPAKTATIGSGRSSGVCIPVLIPTVPNLHGSQMTCSHSSGILDSDVSFVSPSNEPVFTRRDSNASFSSTSTRLSGRKSSSSFDSFHNLDSGINSPSSSSRRDSFSDSFGSQIIVSRDEVKNVYNGLNRTNSLDNNGEFTKPLSQMNINVGVHQHDTTAKPKSTRTSCNIM